MENDFGVDLDGVMKLIKRADVLVVRFQVVELRLLIDMRTNATEGPMICLVPRARSAQDRFQTVKRLRPHFPMPERIMSFEWPRSISSMESAGIWRQIRTRLLASGHDEAGVRCDAVYHDLMQREHDELQAAIRGADGYQTLWEHGH